MFILFLARYWQLRISSTGPKTKICLGHTKVCSRDILVNMPVGKGLYTIKAFVMEDDAAPVNFVDTMTCDQSLYCRFAARKKSVCRRRCDRTTHRDDEVSPEKNGKYFSQYSGAMEPWEVLMHSGGLQLETEFRVADTLSASLTVLLVLDSKGKLIRYASSQSAKGAVYGVFVPNLQREGVGIPFRSGTLFPLAEMDQCH